MNIVWPVTALFGTVFRLWAYFRYGLDGVEHRATGDRDDARKMPAEGQPLPVIVAKGTLHCGAGCMIGDAIAEWLAYAVPAVAIWLGWQTAFAQKIFAVWVLDFAFAFCLGIVFQYLAIVPMRKVSFGQGLVAALKADTLSLASWQIGMYGFLAFAQFCCFKLAFGIQAEVDTPEFGFAMQLAMMAGFMTAYPVNWWLIRIDVKESM